MSEPIEVECPYLALGSNSEWGFLFSRTIEHPMDRDTLIEYMNREAGSPLDSILIIKNDQVVIEFLWSQDFDGSLSSIIRQGIAREIGPDE